MSFYLYTGNRLDELVRKKLCGEILSSSFSDPFICEQIVVPNQSVAAWLKQQIALNLGICANVEFLLLKDFESKLLKKSLHWRFRPATEYFSKDFMVWKIFQLLPDIALRYDDLTNYLYGLSDEDAVSPAVLNKNISIVDIKKFQLANKIAAVFEKYQQYRPDMVNSWEKGDFKGINWQAELWNKLCENKISPSASILNFIEKIDISKLDITRISFFGFNTIPPAFLEILQKLGDSSSIALHFFLFNPCSIDWKILLNNDPKSSIREKVLANQYVEDDDCFKIENKLLNSYGRSGCEFISLINSINLKNVSECFLDWEPNTILNVVKNDILYNTHRHSDFVLKPTDHSIQFHSCHSPMREIEVLYDNILNIFSQNSDIQPRDILVMGPDISLYAPYIKSVFERRNLELSDNIKLPYSLIDVQVARNSKIITAFFEILKLRETKFKVSQVLDILEIESVRMAFSIADEELNYIRKWIVESGIRWGIDGEHRSSFGLPYFDENSWQSGFDRLMLGFAMEGDGSIYDNTILPYDEIEGGTTELLGKFSNFIHTLFELRGKLFGKHMLDRWQEILDEIVELFFESDNDTFADITLIRRVLRKLKKSSYSAVFNDEVSIEIVLAYLEKQIDSETMSQGFMRGKVTFCGLMPMRNLPRKVVCLLGMSDGALPRDDITIGFDEMKLSPALCDHSAKFEDRYIFLEALLSAASIFYVSYIGQDIKTCEHVPPAIPVCELIDYLKQIYGSDFINVNHKLQAFNSEYFQNKSNGLFSYSLENKNASCALNLEQQKRFLFKEMEKLPQLRLGKLLIDDFLSFFKNPCKALIAGRMGINITSGSRFTTKDIEPIILDPLEQYSLNQKIVRALIDGKSTELLYEKLKLENNIPIGFSGNILFREKVEMIDEILNNGDEVIPMELLTDSKPFHVDFKIGDCTIAGVLDNVVKDKYQVYFQYAAKNGNRIIEGWIRHLIFCASGNSGDTYCFIGKEMKSLYVEIFTALTPVDAIAELSNLLCLYNDGMAKPLPFFPKSSYLYAIDKKNKFTAARNEFTGEDSFGGASSELEDQYVSLCFDESVIETDEFKACAETVFQNFWENER
jgi:exodeoxyribonuclease V gamma subunit